MMGPAKTLERFIYSQERSHNRTTGELSDLLSAIVLGVKMIARLVETAPFKGLYGSTGQINVQGEETQILDREADEILCSVLGSSGHFGLLVSEERDSVVAADKESASKLAKKYVVAFDPLDGSSNLGSNIPVGTIFCIFKKKANSKSASADDYLQSGRNIVAAGYAVYGSKTCFVYSAGDGVHSFLFDPGIGEFVLTEETTKMPEKGKIYSINEGQVLSWDPRVRSFIDKLKIEDKALGTPYSSRYVGSLVADFDRNLKKGGIYIYPAGKNYPNGKLRLLYECLPLAFIAEQAGGAAINGPEAILDIVPSDIHQRSALIIGSKFEVEWYRREVLG